MNLYQLTVPKDDSWEVMDRLGLLNVAHFLNLNKSEQPFNLPYVSQIRRCEETERRLLHILHECRQMRVKVTKPRSQTEFLEQLKEISDQRRKAMSMLFEEIEQEVLQKERFVTDQMEKLREMQENFVTMLDYQKVLEKVAIVLPQIGAGQARQSFHGGINVDHEETKSLERMPLMGSMDDGVKITHIAGTIEVEEKDRLKRLLFRATRGKALTFFEDFKIDAAKGISSSQKLLNKSVYIVVFQEGRQIREKIMRICDSFMGQRFDVPAVHNIRAKIEEVKRNIEESRLLNKTSRNQLKEYLKSINHMHSGLSDSRGSHAGLEE